MQQPSRLLSLAAAVALLAGPRSNADVLSGSFAPTVIPDAFQSGIALQFPAAPEIESLDKIAITLAHEWVGDLTVRFLAPNGAAFTLIDRLDVSKDPPDGSPAILGGFEFENGRGILRPRRYEFAATGLDFGLAAEAAVQTEAAPIVPPGQIYAADSWQTGPFPAGVWTLSLADRAEFSNGLVSSAEMFYSVTAVPEPTVLVLFLTGLGLSLIIKAKHPGCAPSWPRFAAGTN
ncbi:MAG: PEP-CTERM sorting domain-containing protein [Verrucomicrobiota bacterium]